MTLVGFDETATYPIFRLGGLIMKNSIVMLMHYLLRTQYVPDPVLPSLLKRKQILTSTRFLFGNGLKQKKAIKLFYGLKERQIKKIV